MNRILRLAAPLTLLVALAAGAVLLAVAADPLPGHRIAGVASR
jgi:hypothetical protein